MRISYSVFVLKNPLFLLGDSFVAGQRPLMFPEYLEDTI